MNILAANFLNSIFGTGLLGEGALGGSANGTAASPFAALLGNDADEKGTNTKPALSGILSNNKGVATLDDIVSDSNDLTSPELLLSDLMAVNWQALQKGDSLQLPSGWTISVNEDGSMALAQPDGQIAFPSFSPEQLQDVLDQFKSAGMDFLPLMEETPAEAAKDKAHAENKAEAKDKAKDLAETQARQTNAAEANAQASKSQSASDVNITVVKNTALTPATPTDASSQDVGKNPLQPLLQAAFKEQSLRNEYLYAPTSAYASTGARGSLTSSIGASFAPVMSRPGSAPAFGLKTLAEGSAKISPLLTDISDSAFSVGEGFTMMDQAIDADSTAQLPNLLQQNGIRVGTDGQLYGSNPVPVAQLNLIIQKMSEKPDTRVLTVRLDPPELGRVQVQLSSGHDKAIRASIVVEKPEALNQLKRDLASLEKALHDAGISLEDGAISLDLAMDDNSGNGFWAQQAFQEMWSENNAARHAQNGTEVANSNIDEATGVSDDEEFYQTDLAVNIKV